MSLQRGDRLGPYEIVAPIGAGGMGEVYQARDARLERSVAIKVMPEELRHDSAMRERFQREAKSISALSHPHICTLHDVGSHDGIDYLVMEHLEGETLADRLTRGALPIEHVLTYGMQIADALEKAHRAGIIHRDLKPGNIMLTRSGAKLLDFGLSKHYGSPPGTQGSIIETEQKPITEQGTILGTYLYMSPEQLEGTAGDPRTDIFALGAILYEMATGIRAFSGKTRTSLIAAIVSSEPRAISEIQPLTPPLFERLVRQCLAKDPDARWQSAHDVRLELETIALMRDAGPATPRSRTAWAGWAAAAIIAAMAGGWWLYDSRGDGRAEPRYRFEIHPPADVRFNAIDGPAVLAPDGRQFAVRMGGAEGRQQFWLRAMDDTQFRPLRGTEGGFDPFWSPDGRHFGFFSDGKLRRLDLSTSAVTTICAANDGRGASWGRDGTVLLTLSSVGPIYRVPATGGTPQPATKLDASRKETAHWRPSFLPDGKRFLFMALSENSDDSGVYLGSIESQEVRRVLNIPTPAVYAEPGHLLYVNDTDLYAQPFDADDGVTTGPGALVARGIDYGGQFATGAFSVANGTLLFHKYASAPGTPLTRMPVEGEDATVINVEGVNLDLSRDGSRIAMMRVEVHQRNSDIWTYDLRRGVSSRITFEAAEEVGPVWSPDGKSIAYVANSAAGISVMIAPSGGGGNPETFLSTRDSWIEIVDWSSDGRTFIAEMDRGATRLDVVTIDLATKEIKLLAATPFIESSGRFSPDGKWIAYRSDESGRSEIYVQPFPADGTRWQVSSAGGESPRWTADGKQLFYVTNEGVLMSAGISTSPAFEVSAPRTHRRIDSEDLVITPDGKEVIVSTRGSREAQPIVVMTNWLP